MFSQMRCNVLILLVVSIILPTANLKSTKSPDKRITVYLRENWQIFFKCLDLNGDGLMSVADRDILRHRYVSAFDVGPEEKTEMEYSINFFWQSFVLWGNNSNTFSEDEFIDYLSKSYLDDEHFLENAVLFEDIMVEMIDVDKDGKISKTELFEYYKDLGYHNQKFVENYFNAYNPTQDKIPTKQMSRAWADFLASNHKTDNNFIRKFMIIIIGLQNKFRY